MNDKIYIIDTETTGLRGAPYDLVLDVGVAEVDLAESTYREAFSSVVGYDVKKWDRSLKESWIFSHSDLTLEMVENAEPQESVAEKLRSLLNGKTVTAYNVGYDFGKFLIWEPWSLKDVRIFGDVMLSAADCLKIPGNYGQYRWPKLETAYGRIVPGDPVHIADGQEHRALSDAMATAALLIQLDHLGYWPRDPLRDVGSSEAGSR